MKRLILFIILFFLALAIPLGILIHRTEQTLIREERAEFAFFSQALFDRMEQELAELVQIEENRPVDQYQPSKHSPLSSQTAWLTAHPYIVGYFQNGPDGSFATPLSQASGNKTDFKRVLGLLKEANTAVNKQKGGPAHDKGLPPVYPTAPLEAAETPSPPLAKKDLPAQELESKKSPSVDVFGDRYITQSTERSKFALGRQSKRVEELTAEQAYNLANRAPEPLQSAPESPAPSESKDDTVGRAPVAQSQKAEQASERAILPSVTRREIVTPQRPSTLKIPIRAEVDPLQTIFLDDVTLYLFRRVVVDGQSLRQGLVISLPKLVEHLSAQHFLSQPMSGFTRLNLKAMGNGAERWMFASGSNIDQPIITLTRGFPRPFAFLTASLSCKRLPRSPGRDTLRIMTFVLAGIIILGLLAIYQSARVVVDLSKKRSAFVSSVTHELKTPLTTIRMYIEMLEQGMARTPEQEGEYYRILSSETSRLSRLISNVLEFSKLERKKRSLDVKPGTLDEVIRETLDVLGERIHEEGFVLNLDLPSTSACLYDREAMVQVLINLLDNSMKFGKSAARKELCLSRRQNEQWVVVSVSDSGPGIDKKDLRHIFDDFYRGDDALKRSIKGAGLGLALVKRLVQAMGGLVRVENNKDQGCTVSVSLPLCAHV